MSNFDSTILPNYAGYLERRFNRLELKELRAPYRRREAQMEKYLDELDAVLRLIDSVESEAA